MLDEPEITQPGGNVFEDLGLEDAANKKLKLRLAVAVNQDIKERGLTQIAAADLLGTEQPRISALANYKLAGFSLDKLFEFVTLLGRDLDLGIGQPKGNQRGRIRVHDLETA